MTWTSERPTTLGWYWFHGDIHSTYFGTPRIFNYKPMMCQVIKYVDKVQVSIPSKDDVAMYQMSNMDGHWAGPLEPPE
jgi:hypothetical protein